MASTPATGPTSGSCPCRCQARTGLQFWSGSIAEREGVSERRIGRILRLAWPAPDIVRIIHSLSGAYWLRRVSVREHEEIPEENVGRAVASGSAASSCVDKESPEITSESIECAVTRKLTEALQSSIRIKSHE